MATRPKLSDESFLGHLFSPSKTPLPSGIRKTKLKGLTGQRKTRVAAFNRMTPFKQELLKRSGTRDSYLRGETTLADAKRTLRPKAIAKGLARPLRTAKTIITDLDKRIARYLITKLSDDGIQVNVQTIAEENEYLGANADEGMLRWDTGRLKYAGRSGSEYEVYDNGRKHNPFWYH